MNDDILNAYLSGNYDIAGKLIGDAGMSAQDVISKYNLNQNQATDVAKNLGYTGNLSGLSYLEQPQAQMSNTQTANVQNLPVIPNNNASNTSFLNPVDTEISNYYDKNKNLFENKDYNTIASDMYVNKFTPEALARVKGWDQKAVTDLYNQTYGAFDRATQEDLVNQRYKQQLGLTDAQLGQRNFGADMSTRESRSTNRPLSTEYNNYQKELAATGRRDAPIGTQFRAKAVYMPDSIGNRGSIQLIDSATGQQLTNLGANNIGNTRDTFELLDKFGVDPASYKQAASQMYETTGKQLFQKDDYDYLTSYKPRDVAGATDAYLRTPLAKASVADLKYNPEKDANNRFTQDTRTNIDWLGSTQRLLMSKGMGDSEATNYLHQFIPVAGLVDWAEIGRSEDPVKAIISTLNYLQSKGLTNRQFASGGLVSNSYFST